MTSKTQIFILLQFQRQLKNKLPDLDHVKSAFKLISKYIKSDDIVILESTVYPGTTLDVCKNILKKIIERLTFL